MTISLLVICLYLYQFYSYVVAYNHVIRIAAAAATTSATVDDLKRPTATKYHTVTDIFVAFFFRAVWIDGL